MLLYYQKKSPLLNVIITRSEKCVLIFAYCQSNGCDTFIIYTPLKPSTQVIEKIKCLMQTGELISIIHSFSLSFECFFISG